MEAYKVTRRTDAHKCLCEAHDCDNLAQWFAENCTTEVGYFLCDAHIGEILPHAFYAVPREIFGK